MSVNVTPLHDRVLIKRIEEKESIKGGIIIPDTAKEKPQEGEVIAVGAGKIEKGRTHPARREGRATAFCSASTAAPKSRSTTRNT